MSDRVISKSEILSRVPNKYALSSRAGVFLSMPIENKIVSVVDEESSTARLFHDTLCTIKGIDVFQFTDPIKALEHLKLHKGDYGVIISDLRMPVVNGVQLLKTVKDLNPLARTILVTAYDIDNNFAPRVH
ncbi:MAG: response regulator [Nitrososphaeraceae archaeon]|nr:response regulator [Nitrososphaeraceae archaeon]MDW0273438.1 response regulator [Nitrososphaeraceae archaeon]MDW0335734.1 response regulator [Nitrososphaeraceae archaeon]